MNMNELDLQKLHLAPKPVQFVFALGLAVLMVVAGYFVMFQGQYETVEAEKAKEVELKEKYKGLSTKAVSLETLKLELKAIDETTAELIKQLPKSSEIPNLIQELYQAAARNNLTMGQVLPKPIVHEDENIQRLPFLISVTGSYEQLAQFLRDVGRMSRIVTLSSVNIEEPKTDKDKGKNRLTLSAIASTYKAVEPIKQEASAASGAASAAQ